MPTNTNRTRTGDLMRFFKKLTQTLTSLVLVVAIGVGLTACGGGSGGSSSSNSVPPSVYYTVTNLRDSGDGSLRAAILAVNQAPEGQYSGINFAVSGIIVLTANLPTINRKVLIDGTTAPGYVAANGPSVLLNFVTSYDGLNFYRGSEGSSLLALTIINSSTHGVTLRREILRCAVITLGWCRMVFRREITVAVSISIRAPGIT